MASLVAAVCCSDDQSSRWLPHLREWWKSYSTVSNIEEPLKLLNQLLRNAIVHKASLQLVSITPRHKHVYDSIKISSRATVCFKIYMQSSFALFGVILSWMHVKQCTCHQYYHSHYQGYLRVHTLHCDFKLSKLKNTLTSKNCRTICWLKRELNHAKPKVKRVTRSNT